MVRTSACAVRYAAREALVNAFKLATADCRLQTTDGPLLVWCSLGRLVRMAQGASPEGESAQPKGVFVKEQSSDPQVKMGRRYKAYAAETGVSYRYFFDSRRRVARPEGQGRGCDFDFVITADQHPPFVLRIFVSDRALARWRDKHGRDLDSNEQYAAAKMRLFRAFDTEENLHEHRWSLVVDDQSVEELLEPLNLA